MIEGMRALPTLGAHILHRFDVGGLEDGVVNHINHMLAAAQRHMLEALTEALTEARYVGEFGSAGMGPAR